MGMKCSSRPPSPLPHSPLAASYLVPMGTYVKHRTSEASFYEVMAIANRKKHLAIGYKVPPPLLSLPHRLTASTRCPGAS
jgi:hypothetical protein